MSGWGWFFLILFLLLGAFGGYVGFRIWNARKHGDPIPHWKSFIPFLKSPSSSSNYPTPRSSGPVEWIKDKIAGFRQGRTTRGGYEESRGDVEGGYANANRSAPGRGRGLEDDAWDTRVGNEDPYGGGLGGYHEEQELGLAPTPGQTQPYSGSDYIGQNTEYSGPSAERGRSQQRAGPAQADRLDPFGDQNEAASMRSVSPRPDGEEYRGHTRGQSSLTSDDGSTSPISTRKSAFREGI